MKNTITLIILCLSINAFSSDTTECWKQLNRVDSLLTKGNLPAALEIYEDLGECVFMLSNTRLYGMSQMYYSIGNVEKAKEELIAAVNKGLIWSETKQDRVLALHKYCLELGGEEFQILAWGIHLEETNRRLEMNSELMMQLKFIEDKDQQQREEKETIEFYVLDESNLDTDQQNKFLDDLEIKFREANREVILMYIDLIDSLGYAPSDDDAFGFASNVALINHASAYPTDVNLDSILLHSVEIGTLSPKSYANFIGYRAEKQGYPDPYLYTASSETIDGLKRRKKKKIDKARSEIGLPLLPLTMWRMFGLE